MDAQWIAILILSPFVAAVIYAGVHEYRRYKSAGPATYGLVYDEKTGTTHVTEIAEDRDAYDPEEYDPNSYNKEAIEAASSEPEESAGTPESDDRKN
jgi:hypothetical protein